MTAFAAAADDSIMLGSVCASCCNLLRCSALATYKGLSVSEPCGLIMVFSVVIHANGSRKWRNPPLCAMSPGKAGVDVCRADTRPYDLTRNSIIIACVPPTPVGGLFMHSPVRIKYCCRFRNHALGTHRRAPAYAWTSRNRTAQRPGAGVFR